MVVLLLISFIAYYSSVSSTPLFPQEAASFALAMVLFFDRCYAHAICFWVLGTTIPGVGCAIPMLLVYVDWSQVIFTLPAEGQAAACGVYLVSLIGCVYRFERMKTSLHLILFCVCGTIVQCIPSILKLIVISTWNAEILKFTNLALAVFGSQGPKSPAFFHWVPQQIQASSGVCDWTDGITYVHALIIALALVVCGYVVAYFYVWRSI